MAPFCSVLLVFCCLASCSRNEPTNAETGAENQVLHYANGDEPRSLDPHLTTGSPDNNIIMNLFEGLTSKHPRTLEPQPGVAESWTVSEDGKHYTFQLRKNAQWSNGDPVTADDFVFSWRRALTPTLPNQYAYMLFYIKNAQEYYEGTLNDFSEVGVRAVDPYTLEVELNHPTAFFLQLLDHHSMYPVHRKVIEQFGGIDDPNSKWILPSNFVGNGPFVLSDWQVNKVISLQKSPTYWDRGKVKLKAAHFYPIDDQQAEERAFRSGMVHLTNTPQMDIEKVAYYKREYPAQLRITQTYASYYYELNTGVEPLDDVRVRKALAYAIDRSSIVNNVTKAGEVEAYSLVPPTSEGYSPQSYFQYDPEEARRLLAEAGFPNGEGFPSLTILYNTHDNHRKVALAIQQMLKTALNINVQLENKEWKVYMAARDNLEHQVARAGWIADYLDPSNFFDILRSYSGNNRTNWGSERYDQIMEQVEASADPDQRNQLFETANRMLFEEMPIIPIYYYTDINLVSPAVKGWYDNVMHFHPLKEVYLDSAGLVKMN